jgi:hypothetical protein
MNVEGLGIPFSKLLMFIRNVSANWELLRRECMDAELPISDAT